MRFAKFRVEMPCNLVGDVSEDPTACRLEIDGRSDPLQTPDGGYPPLNFDSPYWTVNISRLECKKTASTLIHDVVHGLYQGVLYV